MAATSNRSYRHSIAAFDGTDQKSAKRLQLFTEPALRRVALDRLALQFTQLGACRLSPKVRLFLAARNIRETERELIRRHFDARGRELCDE